jgi:hypothetical protein
LTGNCELWAATTPSLLLASSFAGEGELKGVRGFVRQTERTVAVFEMSRSFVPQDDRKRGDISKIVILVPVTASPVMRMARAID